MNEDATPLILAIASGKGGVGKTMLTVACAHELSIKGRTLLLDLDFFNRGLTGLLSHGKELCVIERPAFLGEEPSDNEHWRVLEVAPNLLHVAYPDLLPSETAPLETLDVVTICESLRKFIQRICEDFKCLAVVLDCHRGPDRTSIAASLLANYTLLISEPDRITFHGTLNFLRQLERVTPEGAPAPDIRLVFNKVLPAFRSRFLLRLYDEYLRDEFGGRDLLAIFPMEVYLTKAFEETPVLTAIYPHSLLARKMRLLLRDLLFDKGTTFLSPGIVYLNAIARTYRRRTLGKTPWFVDLHRVITVIGVLCVLIFAINFAAIRYVETRRNLYYSALDVALCVALQDVEFQRKLDATEQTLRDRAKALIQRSMTTESELPNADNPSARIIGRTVNEAENRDLRILFHEVPISQEKERIFGQYFNAEDGFDEVLLRLCLGQITLPEHLAYAAADRAASRLRDVEHDWVLLAALKAPLIIKSTDQLGIIALAWILSAFLWATQSWFNTALTRAVRGAHPFRAVAVIVAALSVWVLPIYYVTTNPGSSPVEWFRVAPWGNFTAGLLMVLAVAWILMKQFWVTWRIIRYEPCRREVIWRSIFLALLIVLWMKLLPPGLVDFSRWISEIRDQMR